MSYMFSECSSLVFLHEISKWKTETIKNIKGIFDGCPKIMEIPSQFYEDI